MRILLWPLTLVWLAGCSVVIERAGLPAPTSAAGETLRVRVPMRDGVKLATDVYLPAGQGPWPVILIRNPYNFVGGGFAPVAKLFSYYGYVGVHQLARGRADSEGAWNPFWNERNDGLDTLAWLKAQPWNNGNVGMVGASYLSMVQWAISDSFPPEVKTMVPVVWGGDVHGVVYQGGMFRPELATAWAALMHDSSMDYFNMANFHAAVAHRPAIDSDEILGGRLPWLREWQMSPAATAPIWQSPEAKILRDAAAHTRVPVLMISGWYDIFLFSQIDDFNRLPNRESRIIVGPWTHLTGMDTPPDKPMPGGGDLRTEFGRVLNWLDHYLKGAPLEAWGPVRTYAIGEGQWHDRPAWPPATGVARLYLSDLEKSNACAGGRLTQSPPAKHGAVSYAYDPEHPVPSRGGSELLAFALPGWGGTAPSVRLQTGLCKRDDVLSFVSAPVGADVSIAGPVAVEMDVATDVDDTAFTVKLIEVAPDGSAVNMRDVITALSYRNGATAPVSYTPGAAVRLRLVSSPIEWQIKKGYALRLDVSSSNAPAYVAHTNYAGAWWSQTKTRVAHQTLQTSPQSPAVLELPVVKPVTAQSTKLR
jgi:putative CocE/NonD family hydrolase